MGRPSGFSQSIANTICERLANGESLRGICEDADLPAKSTVFKWLTEQPSFSDQYTRAREAQADALFDDILTIADDGRNDWMERKDAEEENIGWRENGEALRRSQLRIESRKWMAGKLKPKKYGEKIEVDNNHSISDPMAALLERIATGGNRLGVSKNMSENEVLNPAGEQDIAQDGR